MTSKALTGYRLNYLRLIKELNDPDVDLQRLEDVIKQEASLTLRLLRRVNSAAYGFRMTTSSLRHALVLLGEREIRLCATVWSLAEVGQGPAVGGHRQLHAARAALRAAGQRRPASPTARRSSSSWGCSRCSTPSSSSRWTQILSTLPLSDDVRARAERRCRTRLRPCWTRSWPTSAATGRTRRRLARARRLHRSRHLRLLRRRDRLDTRDLLEHLRTARRRSGFLRHREIRSDPDWTPMECSDGQRGGVETGGGDQLLLRRRQRLLEPLGVGDERDCRHRPRARGPAWATAPGSTASAASRSASVGCRSVGCSCRCWPMPTRRSAPVFARTTSWNNRLQFTYCVPPATASNIAPATVYQAGPNAWTFTSAAANCRGTDRCRRPSVRLDLAVRAGLAHVAAGLEEEPRSVLGGATAAFATPRAVPADRAPRIAPV